MQKITVDVQIYEHGGAIEGLVFRGYSYFHRSLTHYTGRSLLVASGTSSQISTIPTQTLRDVTIGSECSLVRAGR
jgi:hypothetical protein